MSLQAGHRFVQADTCAQFSGQLQLGCDAALGPYETSVRFEVADGGVQDRAELRKSFANVCG